MSSRANITGVGMIRFTKPGARAGRGTSSAGRENHAAAQSGCWGRLCGHDVPKGLTWGYSMRSFQARNPSQRGGRGHGARPNTAKPRPSRPPAQYTRPSAIRSRATEMRPELRVNAEIARDFCAQMCCICGRSASYQTTVIAGKFRVLR